MAEYVLQLAKQEHITMPAAVADKLIRQGDGDAALLYLLLLRRQGRIGNDEVIKTLRFSEQRLAAAEKMLHELGLLGEKQVELAPAEEKPTYTQLEIAERLEGDETFRLLRAEVEKLLGRRMTTADCTTLLVLYDHLALTADVIFQLVCHCVERSERAYGTGRRPTLNQISKEGYIWHRRGIDSIPRANAYLKTYHQRQGLLPAYMRALQLGDRNPAPSEEKYLTEWMDMGFTPEVVALAYDRTMLRCHELKWSYLGGILKKWHEKGLKTVDAIEQGENKSAPAQPARGEESDIQKYVQKMHRKR